MSHLLYMEVAGIYTDSLLMDERLVSIQIIVLLLCSYRSYFCVLFHTKILFLLKSNFEFDFSWGEYLYLLTIVCLVSI